MASGAYTSGITKMLDGSYDFLTDVIRVILIRAAVYTFNKDDDFVDAGGSSDVLDAELSVSGYTGGHGGSGRKALASKTITTNDTSDRVEVDCADFTWTALASGQTIAAAVVEKPGTSDDTTAILICYMDPTDVPTNGSDITLTIASNGFLWFAT